MVYFGMCGFVEKVLKTRFCINLIKINPTIKFTIVEMKSRSNLGGNIGKRLILMRTKRNRFSRNIIEYVIKFSMQSNLDIFPLTIII